MYKTTFTVFHYVPYESQDRLMETCTEAFEHKTMDERRDMASRIMQAGFVVDEAEEYIATISPFAIISLEGTTVEVDDAKDDV